MFLYLLQDCLSGTFIYKKIKNFQFTDIDSNENIDFFHNDRNFEILYFPK